MENEYLVTYGVRGEQGRFRCDSPLSCRRGDRVVIRTVRGVEFGEVLCPITARHLHLWPDVPSGPLLRVPTDEDHRAIEHSRLRGLDLFEEARQRVQGMALPIQVLDAEVLLDGEHGALYFVRWEEFDARPLVSGLSRQLAITLSLTDLTRPDAVHEHEHEGGCGDCGSGSCGSGGCGSGGCGTCGTVIADDVRAYFAELREKMHKANRIPLN